MPVQRGKDSKGPCYQWGEGGKRYHYTSGDKGSRDQAKRKAEKHGRAARAHGFAGQHGPCGRDRVGGIRLALAALQEIGTVDLDDRHALCGG